MKSLVIAWNDFTIRLRDRKGFLLMIVMPLVLTAILGSALSTVMEGDGGFPETTVGLYMEGQDSLADTFQDEVLQEMEFVKVREGTSKSNLKNLVEEGKIDVGLAFPSKWSANLAKGELKAVELFTNAESELKASVMEEVLKSYSDRLTTMSASTQIVMSDLTQATTTSTGAPNLAEAAQEITTNITAAGKKRFTIEEEAVGEKMVSSMQYYAAAMAVMFLLFNTTLGAKTLLQEKSTETLSRLMISPTGKGSILTGKFFGTLSFALLQLIIFYGVTTVFFDVNWGGEPFQLIAVGLAYAVAVSGISMLLAALVTEEKTTDLISGVGIQIFAILGGSMLPIYLFPETLQQVASITPNKWALTSFLSIMSGTSWQELFTPVAVLLCMGLVSLGLGTWRLRFK